MTVLSEVNINLLLGRSRLEIPKAIKTVRDETEEALGGVATDVAALATVESSDEGDPFTDDFAAVARSYNPCDPTSAGFTATLPPIAGLTVDDAVTIANESSSSNTITVEPDDAETISGAASYALSGAWLVVTFIPSRGNWIASVPP